jgi:hypothetical protein
MSHVVARSTCPAHWFPATREEEAHINCATVAESPDHLRVPATREEEAHINCATVAESPDHLRESYPNNANDGQGVGNGGRSSRSGGDSLWKSETMTKFGREYIKCTKCKKWNTTHMVAHQVGIGRRARPTPILALAEMKC